MLKQIGVAALALAAVVMTGCASSSSTLTPPTGAAGSSASIPGISTVSPSSSPTAASSSASPSSSSTSSCDASLWVHVYHSYRLHIKNPCVTVTGTVDSVKAEPDGDLHIRLKTDPQWINAVNVSDQGGDLVVETICVGQVTQADAVTACHGVTSHVTIPKVGQKVAITGSWVLDADHGWLEVHPVTTITIEP